MAIRSVPLLLLLCLAGLFYSCATPIAPQGGPPDRTPPEISETEPETGTVNFEDREFRFSFSKFIDRASFREALQVEPDLGINYEVSFGRRSATVEFEQNLPENTTLILHIGTDLTDTNNNALATPFQLAVSTGPEIDDASVTARLVNAADGRTDSGLRLFLYREPVDFTERANYIAESDTSGRVQFSYLAADRYRAIWVDDQNRNRVWEQDRERAQPFSQERFTLEKGEEMDLGTLFMVRPDTTRPRLQGVGMLTGTRLRLRFDEEIYWADEARIELQDSTGTHFSDAFPLYILPDDHQILIAESKRELEEERPFWIRLEEFADSSGNSVNVLTDSFIGSAEPDTVGLTIVGDNSLPGLFREEALVVGYNKIIRDRNVVDSLKVAVGDEIIEEWPEVEIDRHRLIIHPDPVWESGIAYQFLIWNPVWEELRPVEPAIWQENQLGSLEVFMEESSDSSEYRIRVFDPDRKVDVDSTFTESLVLDRLPPLDYTVIVFRDSENSGEWESGSVDPFREPEPYFVRRRIPVREGFTSELGIRFGTTGSLEEDSPD
ncbi:MAG: Ig-like domain-containing protein [Balneolaceae bacterium]